MWPACRSFSASPSVPTRMPGGLPYSPQSSLSSSLPSSLQSSPQSSLLSSPASCGCGPEHGRFGQSSPALPAARAGLSCAAAAGLPAGATDRQQSAAAAAPNLAQQAAQPCADSSAGDVSLQQEALAAAAVTNQPAAQLDCAPTPTSTALEWGRAWAAAAAGPVQDPWGAATVLRKAPRPSQLSEQAPGARHLPSMLKQLQLPGAVRPGLPNCRSTAGSTRG